MNSARFSCCAQLQEEKSAVWKRRLVEAFAIITVGDGLIEFLAPKEHSRRMRVLGAAQVVLGVWLALRQHRDI